MPQVHSTAILDGDVQLASDVVVGPQCVLTGPISIDSGTRLLGNVWLTGPLTLGKNNLIYPFACLGFAGQDLKWDPAKPGAGLKIGDENTFREQVTIHRATSGDNPTSIGNHNYFMACSHAGHDCMIGNHCIFANGTLLAGFVRVDDHVITGGTALVHQFCRIGRGAMLSGAIGAGRDVPPFFMLTGIDVVGSINLIGMRRSGMTSEEIQDVRWVYKTMYRRGLAPGSVVDALREREHRSLVAEYIEFLEGSQRGFCPGVDQKRRSAKARQNS